ncbi:hypothetical protein Bbelb_300680 [Branchiostoma belcheri]|nr:hypothetical protein Bbelb_300680 [Branchiostoma belcheri]
MAGWKIVVCVLGALGGLFIVTAVDVPCKDILSPGGIPIDQCLGDYVCHNGTLNVLRLINWPPVYCRKRNLYKHSAQFDFLVCGEYWNISYHVTGQLDTGGKCSQRFNREIAGCSQQFLQKFLTGNASSDVLCWEYGRSLQCFTELRRTECCFNQTEQAMLSMIITEDNPFCQCANVTSSVVAMATERPNNMAATVPFSQRGPACNNTPPYPVGTERPSSRASQPAVKDLINGPVPTGNIYGATTLTWRHLRIDRGRVDLTVQSSYWDVYDSTTSRKLAFRRRKPRHVFGLLGEAEIREGRNGTAVDCPTQVARQYVKRQQAEIRTRDLSSTLTTLYRGQDHGYKQQESVNGFDLYGWTSRASFIASGGTTSAFGRDTLEGGTSKQVVDL